MRRVETRRELGLSHLQWMGSCDNRRVNKRDAPEDLVQSGYQHYLINPALREVFAEEYTRNLNEIRIAWNALTEVAKAELVRIYRAFRPHENATSRNHEIIPSPIKSIASAFSDCDPARIPPPISISPYPKFINMTIQRACLYSGVSWNNQELHIRLSWFFTWFHLAKTEHRHVRI